MNTPIKYVSPVLTNLDTASLVVSKAAVAEDVLVKFAGVR